MRHESGQEMNETTTSAPATAYEDITTNVLSLGTGKGAAAAGRVPPGLVIAGLFFNDRNVFRRVERGLTHLPSDPNRGAAEVVVLPAGPELARVSAGVAWLEPESGRWTVVLGESLAPRTDIALWLSERGEAGAAIAIDGPRGLSRLFGDKFTAIRAPITEAASCDALLADPTLPDALRALREGIRRRRISSVDEAETYTVTPQSTSLNEPGSGLTADDPAVALPQFRFLFTEAEEFKRVRAALEEPAPDTHDLYGEALIIPVGLRTEDSGLSENTDANQPSRASQSSSHPEGTGSLQSSDREVIVVGAMAWRRVATGWTLIIGRVRTRSSLVDRWLDDGEGDQRTRVLLATVNKRGSTEQPVAIDLLCRVTDLRPEMQDQSAPFVPFAPDQEPVVTLVRTAAFALSDEQRAMSNEQ
ncbi:MAG: hypothetical protein LC793_20400 [Thermomicrobia bacterium]|nr:hypothetical protein [Thermomicrobia bacterium]MCA1723220.1 hypothetical protein [Thermomicrobia bacterium]